MEKTTSLTPTQLLDVCLLKISRIPYTMETEKTVGSELKEVSELLLKLKSAFTEGNDDVRNTQ